jgi:D-sedoheptulose 7-phosphate isomerase
VLTSISNDDDFSNVFARQIQALGQKGDVALGISTSGNSMNVVRALSVANTLGLHTIALTGEKGSYAGVTAQMTLYVPSNDTPRIQEVHIILGHFICSVVEDILYTHQLTGKKEKYESCL